MKIRTVSDDVLVDVGKPVLLDFIEDSSCKEIDVTDISHIVSYENFEQYVTTLASKLHKGGKLNIGGYDIVELAKAVMRQDFNFLEANRLVYGDVDNPVISQMTLNNTASLLQSIGLKINKKRINGFEFLIEATRE